MMSNLAAAVLLKTAAWTRKCASVFSFLRATGFPIPRIRDVVSQPRNAYTNKMFEQTSSPSADFVFLMFHTLRIFDCCFGLGTDRSSPSHRGKAQEGRYHHQQERPVKCVVGQRGLDCRVNNQEISITSILKNRASCKSQLVCEKINKPLFVSRFEINSFFRGMSMSESSNTAGARAVLLL